MEEFNRKLVGKVLDIVYDYEINPILNNEYGDSVAKETLFDYALEYNNGMRDSLIKTVEKHWDNE